jgi:multicomponent Na+:H+ antiporter subunit F
MDNLFVIIIIFLLANLSVGTVRILRGPSQADRMMAAQLFGTTGVAILLMLVPLLQKTSLLDIALVYALLAVVAAVAFVKRAWYLQADKSE